MFQFISPSSGRGYLPTKSRQLGITGETGNTVPQLRLFRVDMRRKEGRWLFSFDGDGVTLFSDDNQPMAYFPHEMAEDRIVLPSFLRSIEHLGIVGDDGKTIWFAPENEPLAKIKAYLNWTLAIQGPEPIKRLQKQAKTGWYLGFGLLAFGLMGVAFSGFIHFGDCSVHLIWLPAIIALAHAWTNRNKIKEIQKIQASMGKEER